jgi:DNA replication protein DnaC
VAGGMRKEYMEWAATVPLLIIDDFGMRRAGIYSKTGENCRAMPRPR